GAAVAPNWNRDATLAVENARSSGFRRSGRSSPLQIVACPWCGHRLDLGTDVKPDYDRWRTLVFCGDPYGECPFTEARDPDPSAPEGIPVVPVDEELYRLLP